MPIPISIEDADQLKPGDIYEDPFYHPCLCLAVENLEATGISLIDGSYPRAADIGVSDVRKLTLEEAWHWKMFGPRDAEVSPENRWWRNC
jgi:hypothetical protein